MQSRDGTNFEPSTFDSDVERINLATSSLTRGVGGGVMTSDGR